MGSQPIFAWRTRVVCLVLLCAPAVAYGQERGPRPDEPFSAAFPNVMKTLFRERVPDAAPDASLGSVTRLFSARSYAAPRRIAFSGVRIDRQASRVAGRRDDGTNWVFGRPLDGFLTGFDQFGNPAVGQVDFRGEARNFVRQKIVTEILSRTALGRSLSVLVDTGKTGPQEGRSRFVPYVSPKVNAREGKAAITLTWKF